MNPSAEIARPSEAPPRRFETVEIAAARVCVTPQFLWKLLQQQKLTRRKLGRRTLIDAAELDALIDGEKESTK